MISDEPSVGGDELNASGSDDLDDSINILLLVDCLDVAAWVCHLVDLVDAAILSLIPVVFVGFSQLVNPAVDLVLEAIDINPSVNIVGNSVLVNSFDLLVLLSIL